MPSSLSDREAPAPKPVRMILIVISGGDLRGSGGETASEDEGGRGEVPQLVVEGGVGGGETASGVRVCLLLLFGGHDARRLLGPGRPAGASCGGRSGVERRRRRRGRWRGGGGGGMRRGPGVASSSARRKGPRSPPAGTAEAQPKVEPPQPEPERNATEPAAWPARGPSPRLSGRVRLGSADLHTRLPLLRVWPSPGAKGWPVVVLNPRR